MFRGHAQAHTEATLANIGSLEDNQCSADLVKDQSAISFGFASDRRDGHALPTVGKVERELFFGWRATRGE